MDTKLKKDIKKYLSDFDKAKNEDWFEWIQDANELLKRAIGVKEWSCFQCNYQGTKSDVENHKCPNEKR